MIVFQLTMPHVGSWNGKWSGERDLYIRTKPEYSVPKEYWDKDFRYRWDDGWEANVSVTRMPAAEARKLERKSAGFAGYDWMIHSIINYGKIVDDSYNGDDGVFGDLAFPAACGG